MLRWTLAILIVSVGLFVGADAKMYIVDDDGFAQYHSIGEALAVANDGDTIYVKTGTYREHIILNKSVTLAPPRGEEGIVSLEGDGRNDIGIEVVADGCKIEGLTISDFAGPGIYVESAANEIRKNVFVDNVHGIFLNGTSGNVIENNKEQGGYCGIVLLSSSGNTVTGNVAKNCTGSTEIPGRGILLNSAAKNSIIQCQAEGCDQGINLRSGSTENEIRGYDVISCRNGAVVEIGSEGNSIQDCAFENATTAIALNAASKNLITNNSITNSTNGIVLISSTENGVVENGLSGLDFGIIISDVSSANVLTNNKIEAANTGIVIKASSENRFDGNVLSGVRFGLSVDGSTEEGLNNQISESNQIDGDPILYLYGQSDGIISGRQLGHITLASCTNCTIEESSVTNDAIFVYSSSGCIIRNNVVSKAYGILIRGSDDNEIVGNEACENRYNGIMLRESNGNLIGENNLSSNEWYGVLLRESDSNKVMSNTIGENRETGIKLIVSNEAEIAGNSVIGNGVGISLNESSGCIVYRNNLIDNLVQAEDDGENLWDWGALKGGNYWSDHPCVGNPCPDSPRLIEGNNTDYYPFGERDGWA